jgi:hypothetical protein
MVAGLCVRWASADGKKTVTRAMPTWRAPSVGRVRKTRRSPASPVLMQSPFLLLTIVIFPSKTAELEASGARP